MSLGTSIKQARKRLEMSQRVLGRAIGVDQSSVAGWESDRAGPRPRHLQTLAQALSVTAAWLAYGVVESGPLPLIASLGDGGLIFAAGRRPAGGPAAVRVDSADLMPVYYPGALLIGHCREPDSQCLAGRADTVLGFSDGRALLLRSGAWPDCQPRFLAAGQELIWCLPVAWIRRAGSDNDQPYSHSIVLYSQIIEFIGHF